MGPAAAVNQVLMSESPEILYWKRPEALVRGPAVEYRNRFAEGLARLPAERIVEKYVYLSMTGMQQMLSSVFRYIRG